MDYLLMRNEWPRAWLPDRTERSWWRRQSPWSKKTPLDAYAGNKKARGYPSFLNMNHSSAACNPTRTATRSLISW